MRTLDEARAWLRKHADEGAKCPCCTQLAKVYRRRVTSGMAQALIIMWQLRGTDWFYLPDIAHKWQGRDEANLRHFGLIEEAGDRRPDGGRKGWWRVTREGEAFVKGEITIPKYARIYDGRHLGFDGAETISIRDALGARFNYDDLMAGR